MIIKLLPILTDSLGPATPCLDGCTVSTQFSITGKFISRALPPRHNRKIILGQKTTTKKKIILGRREYVVVLTICFCLLCNISLWNMQHGLSINMDPSQFGHAKAWRILITKQKQHIKDTPSTMDQALEKDLYYRHTNTGTGSFNIGSVIKIELWIYHLLIL